MTAADTPNPERATATLTVEEAMTRILADTHVPLATECLPLDQSLGRILAKPLFSQIDQPPWDHSAMDGYAVRHADLSAETPQLMISQRISAGHSPEALAPGTAARIFTGAPVPSGADTVIVQEICTRDGDKLLIAPDDVRHIKPGANIRRQAENFHAGDSLLPAGTRLGAAHLALAASVGLGELTLYRRLRVAFLTSGDELVMPGTPLQPGQIYNSNRFMLSALLRTLGCDTVDCGMIPDRFEPTLEALRQAATQADLVMVSGGVSVGEEDHVRPALEQLGRLDIPRVAMRPGKPIVVGKIGHSAFIGSPGNPVSLFVTFVLFARPLILKLQGVSGDLRPRAWRVRADFTTRKADKRREYQRARLVRDADGQDRVEVFSNPSSAAIHALTWANGLVMIPEHTLINPGDPVDFLPFSELLS